MSSSFFRSSPGWVADVCHREFLCIGDRLLFREGRTKGLGVVTSTGFDKSKFPNAEADEKDRTVVEKAGGSGGKAHDVKVAVAKTIGGKV